MLPFWEVLQEQFPEQRRCNYLPPGRKAGGVLNDEHNLLTHSVTLDMLVSIFYMFCHISLLLITSFVVFWEVDNYVLC